MSQFTRGCFIWHACVYTGSSKRSDRSRQFQSFWFATSTRHSSEVDLRISVFSFAIALWFSIAGVAPTAIAAEVGDPCTFGVEGQCGEGKWCDPEPGTCWKTVKTGKCVHRRRACPRHYRPQCGCNGHTYSNSCVRIWGQQPLAYEGECLASDTEKQKPR